MEDQLTNLHSLQVTPKLRQDLAGAAQWGFITAVIGLISAGVNLVANFSKTGLFASLFFAGIYVLIYIYLINFGRKIKAALQSNDQGLFLEGLKDLQIYFKIIGILMIVVLVIFAAIVLVGVSMGGERL